MRTLLGLRSLCTMRRSWRILRLWATVFMSTSRVRSSRAATSPALIPSASTFSVTL
jgi:hypothetical protein